jgi:hypothetical protein
LGIIDLASNMPRVVCWTRGLASWLGFSFAED